MAGFKQTQIDDDAASLWTFDGDAFDPLTRKLMVAVGGPRIIIDEIDNLNPAILHSDHELYLGYRLGMGSLVSHEQDDQHSCTFGYYGNNPAHPNGYAKSYLEVPHTSSYAFPRFGSFSVEFLFNMSSTGMIYGTYPMFVKSGVIDISYIHSSSNSYVRVIHPGGTIGVGNGGTNVDDFIGGSWFNRKIHLTFTWLVEAISANEYRGTARLYANSHITSENIYIFNDTFPNTNVATPITICGTNTLYWKSAFQIDQIAVYDRALSAEQVAKHVSKAYAYDEYLKNSFASEIWPFSDVDSLVNFDIDPYLGTNKGTYVGDRYAITRATSGPPGIQGATSATFSNQGHAAFIKYASQGGYVPRNESSYTYEWWFKTSEANRGVLFAIQSLTLPFNGPLVQINMKDNQYFMGCIQFTEADNDVVLNSRFLNDDGHRFLFNDGHWHHIAITKQQTTGLTCLWLDGILHDSQILTVKTVGQPGQMLMMNCMPGRLSVNGSVSFLSFYEFPLQAHQIFSHANYSVTYRIRGVVTLLGVPYQAKLRFYSSYTGELIKEMESDANTGEYEATFYNNSHVDILVFDPNDLSVRYRAYGPVVPSEFDDLPINI
jgi:hypothetical protein